MTNFLIVFHTYRHFGLSHTLYWKLRNEFRELRKIDSFLFVADIEEV